MSNKNYLFAPFKDDDDKIREFNEVVIALKYVVNTEETYFHESALHGLRVFIGRMESYYDVIISKLESDNSSFHGQYVDEIEELKLEIKNTYIETNARNIRQVKEIKELKAENRELKADAIHDANVSYELDDKHIDIIKRLETENKSLKRGSRIITRIKL